MGGAGCATLDIGENLPVQVNAAANLLLSTTTSEGDSGDGSDDGQCYGFAFLHAQ